MTPREIRFRAWDKTQKQFVYFELFQGVNNHTPPIYEDADLEAWNQFTGLKDSQGKEIYEGDIVEFDPDGFAPSIEGNRRAVEFIKGMFVLNANRYSYMGKEDYIHFGYWTNEETGQNSCIVIGNIFESPDLLPQTK